LSQKLLEAEASEDDVFEDPPRDEDALAVFTFGNEIVFCLYTVFFTFFFGSAFVAGTSPKSCRSFSLLLLPRFYLYPVASAKIGSFLRSEPLVLHHLQRDFCDGITFEK
jgi:hypothetical protein